jgi:pre-mRNA-processing factor 40
MSTRRVASSPSFAPPSLVLLDSSKLTLGCFALTGSWYDTVNKTSHWEKPAVLQTAFERAMVSTPWKEYTSKGRPYWVHKETKQSVWDLPEELVQLKKEHGQPDEEVKPFFPPLAAPSPVIPTGLRASMSPSKAFAHSPLPGGAPATPLGHPNPEAQTSTSGHALALIPQSMIDSLPAIPVGSSTPHDVPPPTQVNHAPHFDAPRDRFVIPEGGWRTVEQAEEAFEYLLQKAGVQESWAWDVAMRATITDPLYKSLQTLAEKKAVFNKVRPALLLRSPRMAG